MVLQNTTTKRYYVGRARETQVDNYKYKTEDIPKVWLLPLCDMENIPYARLNHDERRDALQRRRIDSVTMNINKLRMAA